MICQEGYENWAMGVDILGEYLCMVGVKNAGVFQRPAGTTFEMRWGREWTTLAEGVVDYGTVHAALNDAGFDGPLCMHNFYDRGMDALIAQPTRALQHLRRLSDQTAT